MYQEWNIDRVAASRVSVITGFGKKQLVNARKIIRP